jgi:hypothetical protein
MWGFALAVCAAAITLKPAVAGGLMGASLFLFLQQQIAHNRRRRKREATA